MILPSTNLRSARAGRASLGRRLAGYALLLAVLGAVVWVSWVVVQIHKFADHDEAVPADAIAVFGAAEYDGRPSPVLRARLDHAVELYQRGIAPLLITLGGADEGDVHSEGGVGHDYLLAHGVPETQIIAETQSSSTEESATRLAVIAQANHLQRVVVVSDGTHLFRIHVLCDREGLRVYTSPRPPGKSISRVERFERLFHEVASYTAWRLGLH
jgi:uncharacterized SAM-binding protein YcdF (DUF218 family)